MPTVASVFGEILLTEIYDVDETAPGEIIPTTMPKEAYSAFWPNSLLPKSVLSDALLVFHETGDAAAESTSEYSRSRLVPSASRRLYCAIFER